MTAKYELSSRPPSVQPIKFAPLKWSLVTTVVQISSYGGKSLCTVNTTPSMLQADMMIAFPT